MKSTAYKICLVALSFFVGYPILATIGRSPVSSFATGTEREPKSMSQ